VQYFALETSDYDAIRIIKCTINYINYRQNLYNSTLKCYNCKYGAKLSLF